MCEFASEVDHRHFHLKQWNKNILVETCDDRRLSIQRFAIAQDRGDTIPACCCYLL